jgi:hypothetical protein
VIGDGSIQRRSTSHVPSPAASLYLHPPHPDVKEEEEIVAAATTGAAVEAEVPRDVAAAAKANHTHPNQAHDKSRISCWLNRGARCLCGWLMGGGLVCVMG